MPITLINSTFTDSFNQTFKVFTANAGDKTTCKFTVLEDISIITTPTVFFNINSLVKSITLSGNNASFIKEGFRVGDIIIFNAFDGNDALVINKTTTIVSLSDTELIYSSDIGVFHGNPNSSTTWLIYKITTRSSFNLSLNFIADSNNVATPSLGSLIDGQETRLGLASNISLNVLAVNDFTTLVPSGKKSGSFAISNYKITRKANVNRIANAPSFVTKKYEIEFVIENPNILFEEKFKGSNCLKLVALMKFSLNQNDNTPTELYYNSNANTGWFDEPYNAGTANSELTQYNIPTLYYNNVGIANQVAFSFALRNFDYLVYDGFEIGASYVTLSDYNKNKKDDQSTLLFSGTNKYVYNGSLPTSLNCVADISLTTVTNTDFNGYRLSVVNGNISFSQFYSDFFDGRNEDDRRIIIWVKCGNVNHILFDGDLQKKMPVGIEITPVTNFYTQENNNSTYADVTQTPSNSLSPYTCNIQDNVNLFSEFQLKKTDVNTSVIASIVAVKEVNNEIVDEFTLDEMSFGLSQQNWDVWGTLYSDRQYNLPNASSKKQGFLKLKNVVDANTKVFRLSYPVMINWRYWLTETNASSIFIGNQTNNKNWRNYSLDSLGYNTYYKLQIERNGVFDYKYQIISFWNYDETGVFTSTIQLFDADTNAVLTSMVLGKKIKVKATHIYNKIFEYDGWGDIMIETTESNPSWLLSSIVPHQTNTQNPLYPITGTTATYTIVNATTRTIECYLDTSKLVGSSFTISSKICDEDIVIIQETFKITEDGVDKLTENSLNKIIE